jgi:hypothetical protein
MSIFARAMTGSALQIKGQPIHLKVLKRLNFHHQSPPPTANSASGATR